MVYRRWSSEGHFACVWIMWVNGYDEHNKGMSLPLFQLEAKQKQDKDRLKNQMSARRQEVEKKCRLIRGLYENFVQGILTNEEYFELKADYEESIRTLSGEIEALEKDMDALDSRLVRCRSMEKDAKSLAQDHALTAELIDRLIERIEIDHERNIHVTFRFKSEGVRILSALRYRSF